jgi:hypothetical protein
MNNFGKPRHVSHVGEIKNIYKMLAENPERKIPLAGSGYRFLDNIKMDLKERGGGECGLDLSAARCEPVMGSCEHCSEPLRSVRDGEFLDCMNR